MYRIMAYKNNYNINNVFFLASVLNCSGRYLVLIDSSKSQNLKILTSTCRGVVEENRVVLRCQLFQNVRKK